MNLTMIDSTTGTLEVCEKEKGKEKSLTTVQQKCPKYSMNAGWADLHGHGKLG